ncbi:unnamed protein product [Caenorhabditis bovis]|uniref:Uncharacterized protein n=1 Tax=Caenorhabditis bovis TaxID=2654633 RepID=A0A8S1EP67_9PELO|nr:unnamed protein product [Caenorhabditis bovis]
MGWVPDDWAIDHDTLIDVGGHMQRMPMFPYFDAAHYLLMCISVREDLGATSTQFSRRHPFSCWLSSMLMSFAGSFLACFLLGEPIISPLKRHNDIILATIVWYCVFYFPFDIVYKLCKIPPIKIILCVLKEVQRTQKIAGGVKYAARLYPESYLVQTLVGVSKGAGSGVVKIVEQLVRGTWVPTNHEILRPSFTTKACAISSIIFTLERHSMYVTAPHDLVYLCVVGFFVYFKLAALLLGVQDALSPIENLFCAVFMGGMFDAFGKAIKATKEAINGNRALTEEEILAKEREKLMKRRKTTLNETPEYFLELWESCPSAKSPLAKKLFRLTMTDSSPEEVHYNKAQEVIVIKGKTSRTEIPLAKSKIEELTAISKAKQGKVQRAKTFSSFAVDPAAQEDFIAFTKCVGDVIENPTKNKRWTALLRALEPFSEGKAANILSTFEQSKLVDSILKFDADEDVNRKTMESLLNAVLCSRVLSYKNENELLQMCIEKGYSTVIEELFVHQDRIISERVLAELLKTAIQGPENLRRKRIEKLILRKYSREALSLSATHSLATGEALEIMKILTEIYQGFEVEELNNDIDEKILASKALSLITVLMNSHANRIINEDKQHQKFAEISNFIIEMQSMISTFSKVQVAFQQTAEECHSNGTVRRIHLKAHKLVL